MKKWIISLFKTYVPAVLWTVLLLALLCTPGKDLPNLGEWTELIKLDKWLHILFFGMMALFYMFPLMQKKLPRPLLQVQFLKISLAVCVWGFCTECIQYFWVSGRTFDLYDAVADAIGATIAYFLAKKYLLNNTFKAANRL
ncbi:MAG: VanZ family protein [Ferruginibacter sp.]